MRWPWSWDRDPASPAAPRELSPPDPVPLPEENELLGVGPIELGERAETLLRDPLLRAAMARVRQDILTMWLTSRGDQAERREQMHAMIVALDNVEQKIRGYILNKRIVQDRRREEEAAERRAA